MYNYYMLHVSIIIVHYSGEEDTFECLRSLQKIKHPNFTSSVIVVDNGSKDGLTIPKSYLPKHTTVLRSDSNLGFTDGNNLGIKEALENNHPDYVLLLNNDTTVEPFFLDKLVKTAEKNTEVGMVSPQIYFSAGHEFHKGSYAKSDLGNVIWYAGGSIDWANLDAFHRGVDEVDRGQFSQQTESEFATGCCVLIPKKMIDTMGMLDSKYFLYLEDVDWSVRIHSAGYKLIFCPEAHVWHKNAGSSGGSGSELQQYYQTRNRLFFFSKYAHLRPVYSSFGDGIAYIYYLLVIWKFAIMKALMGSPTEQKGAQDWIMGKSGKETLA